MNNERRSSLVSAADRLFAVRNNASPIDQLSTEERPFDIDESYELQELLNSKLANSHGHPVGYKIGCTTNIMQQYLKIPHPCAGRVFSKTLQFHSGEYSVSQLCRPGVECEIALQIDCDMPAGQIYTAQNCLEYSATLMPSIELVDDRWVDYQAVPVYSLIADNFFGAGLVVGAGASLGFKELANTTGTLRINGVVVGSGRGGDILGHPCEALAWLANHQVARGIPLRAGDYVSLGSVVKTQWLKAGDAVEIEFEGLGGCSLALSD